MTSPSTAATTPDMPPRKLRLLLLHGFTQSGPLFRAKTRALEKNLQKAFPAAPKPGSLSGYPGGVEFHYLTGPIRLVPADLPFSSGRTFEGADADSEEGAFAWWRRDHEGKPRVDEVQSALAFVGKEIKTAGPFDGVIGFSQGATLAGMVAAALEKAAAMEVGAVRVPDEMLGTPAMRLAVVYSGYRMPRPGYDCLYQNGLETPFLHFIGSVDTVVEEKSSLALVEACREGGKGEERHRLVYHPGGHFVPASQKPSVNALVQFIKDVLGGEEKKQAEEENVEDMDMPF